MRPSLSPLVAVLALFSLVATLLFACGNGKGANGPKRDLPPYSGHAAELFDDVIEPRAVGVSLETPSNPKGDPLLRERTQVSDAVLHVQVATVSSKNEDTGITYTLGFRVLDKLSGNASPGNEFSVKLGKSSPSVGLVRNFEDRLVGKKFVIFVRAFAVGQGEDADLHFHVMPDSKEELDAIRAAAVLAEMK